MGGAWELRGGLMVAESGAECPVEGVRFEGAVLFRRVGARGLWDVVGE